MLFGILELLVTHGFWLNYGDDSWQNLNGQEIAQSAQNKSGYKHDKGRQPPSGSIEIAHTSTIEWSSALASTS